MESDPLQIPGDDATVAFEELLALSGLAREEVVELVEFGAFEPVGSGASWRFSARVVMSARRAARLRDDFGLNPPGMALALAYLDRIDELERKLCELECQLPRG
jgi:chaperone modulatory protein CbpM